MERSPLLVLLLCVGSCTTDAGPRPPSAVDARTVADTPQTDTALSPDLGPPAPEPDTVAVDLDAGWVDASTPEDTAEADTADAPPPPPPPPGPLRYPSDRTHSPVNAYVVERWQSIVAQGTGSAPAVFMQVGDSISASDHFLDCFATAAVALGEHAALQPTLDYLLAGDAAGSTPFDRDSLAVKGGKTAAWCLDGAPSPLNAEIAAIAPFTAVVMFGTNDSGYFAPDTAKMLRWYAGGMFELTDRLLAAGVLPILMTIPPRTNKPALGQLVPVVNAFLRGLAQGRQIPLVDYHREMAALPDQGLSGDGVHPNALGWGQACQLTPEGLQFGYNRRNLVTLRALDRVRRALDGEPLDDGEPPLAGTGSPEDPFEIGALPFVHLADTSTSPYEALDTYPGCDAPQDESGPEWTYRLVLDEPAAVRIAVLDHDGADVDVHLLDASGTPGACLRRAHTLIEGTLAAGEYRLVLDTFVSNGDVLAGEYVLAISPCAADDSRCASPIGPPVPCPEDMVTLSDACMDRYEAPNVAGALPLVMYNFYQAEAWCQARGKRLCTDVEWTAACAGTANTTYPYGDAHQPGVCNDEEVWLQYSQSQLSAWPGAVSTPAIDSVEALFAAASSVGATAASSSEHVQWLYQAEPSGENAGCTNASGVYDLVGNVEEWTRRATGGSGDFLGNLKGRYWAESRTCQSNITSHGNAFRFYEIGFRCCRDL